MIKRGLSFGGLLLVLASPAAGQTIAGDRFTLNTGPCTIRSGAGAPEGVVTGKVCDIYIRTDGGGVGIVYVKDSGASSAGWVTLTPGIPLDPTPGKVLASGSPVSWTATPALSGITGAGNLTLNPAGDIVVGPGGRDVLPAVGFTTTLGALSSKYLALHAAELWVETLVAQQTLATIGGRVVVAPTNILARDVAPGDGAIYVKYPSFLLHVGGVELGSKLFLEAAGKFEAMSVVSTAAPAPEADGSYGYVVQRDNDGSGANQWYAGDAILDTGKVTGGAVSGVIDLYAARGVLSGAGPAIVGSVRGGAAWNDLRPRFAIGNLNGVGYGHSTDIYGFAAGDPAGPNLFVDPINGLHLRYGNAIAAVSIRPDGSMTIKGDGSGVTNIDGGNIRAESITGDKILANSLTVADINATGFGDNLIKNSTFEPNVGQSLGHPSAFAGWSKDLSSSDVPLQNPCCGDVGPGTMQLDPGNGLYMSAVYQAQPVNPGETYRVAFHLYSAPSGGPAFHVLAYQSASGGVPRFVRNPGYPGLAAPDVAADDYSYIALNAATGNGWQKYEYVYTVPAGVRWVSLGLYNFSGPPGGSSYTPIYYDDVTMTRQLGPGSIKASAITADKIAAGAITADKISVGWGSNFLRNSECRTSTSDWFLSNTGAGLPSLFGFNYDPGWTLLSEPSVCYVMYNGAPVGGLQVFSKSYPAIGGKRYEASVYLGMHRAIARTIIQFLDGAGGNVGYAYGNTCPAVNGGGPALSNYCRSGVLMLAPAGTQSVRMFVETEYNGQATPFTFFVRMFLGEAKPYQTELSEWSPAGLTEIDGGLIKTGAIVAQHIAANTITADQLAARTITGDRMAVGTIGAAEIAARSISADRIGVGVLTSTEIAGRSISADRIVAGAITGTELAAASITADKLNVGALSAITANLGTVTAGTITGTNIYGVTLSGSTIYAGGGNEIQLTNSGMYFATGNGSNAAKIDMAGGVIWGENRTLRFDGTDFTFNGNLHAQNLDTGGGVTGLDVVANRTMYSVGMVNGDGIVSRNMPTWGGNVRAVYYNFGEQRFGFWTGAALARANVQPWAPVDPLAILRAPIVSFASGTERELGFSVEGLAELLPELVIRDGAGRPDQIRTEAVVAALLKAIAELERRIKVLEAKGGGV